MSEDKKILARMVRHLQDMPADPFTPLLDEYLVKRERRDSERLAWSIDMRPRFRPGKRLSPSSIGGCQRAAVLSFTGVKGARRVDPRTQMIFETGDWFHHKWQSLFKDMELVLGRDRIEVLGIEERVSHDPLYIAGNLDIRVRLPIKKKMRMVVVDVKSINDYGFKQVAANGPMSDHKEQVTTYCRAAKVKHGALLYENKNTGETLFYLFEYDRAVWGKVKLWCSDVISMLEAGKMPPRDAECDQGNFHYERCAYKRICYGNMDKPQIRELAYRDFPGVEEKWKEGLKEDAKENNWTEETSVEIKGKKET